MTPHDAPGAALEDELDALYAAPLQEFIARRDALAKRLRIAGAAEEARRIKALRKPNTVAWAINRLHFESRGLAGVEAAGEALREALGRSGSAQERRAAIEARRRAVEAAVDAAARLLGETGTSSSPDLLRRLERTLLAIAAGARAADAPSSQAARPGRLDQDLEPPGFEALAGLPLPTEVGAAGERAREKSKRPEEAAARRSVASPGGATGTARAGARRDESPARAKPSARTTARDTGAQPRSAPTPARPAARETQRERAVREAQAALDDAEAELERTTSTVETARARVGDAERALRKARETVDAARAELAAARTRRDALRRELERLRRSGGE